MAVEPGIPVAHLEPALRSRDCTMPEKIDRIVVKEFSEYLFLWDGRAAERVATMICGP